VGGARIGQEVMAVTEIPALSENRTAVVQHLVITVTYHSPFFIDLISVLEWPW